MKNEKVVYATIIALAVFIVASFFILSGAGKPEATPHGQQRAPVFSEFDRSILGTRLDPSLLKTQHIHADFAVFMDGEQVDFNDPKYFLRSAFMHAETDDDGSAGRKLHMHSTNVPLWVFLESVEMGFNRTCIKAGKEYCGNVAFYVNGEPNDRYGDYVFGNGDRILISLDAGDMAKELASVSYYSSKG